MRRDEHGQAAVELALCLPLVAVLLALVLETALVARDQVVLVHVAREAARAAAVDASAGAGEAAAGRAWLAGGPPLGVRVTRDATRTVADVTTQVAISLPIVGLRLGAVHLAARCTMATEG